MLQVANPIYDIVFKYSDNDEVLYILRKLKEAASDSKLRHDMNVEDEYFSAIEKRDTEILMRDKMLAEQKSQLDEQKNQLDEQKNQLDEQKNQLAEKDSKLAEQQLQLTASIKLMLSQNIPVDVIAKALGVSVETIHEVEAL
ncbi:MAG: hypothetical protein MJZ41_06975 [Bacteroidaceae bacterium]|nr:hypothetical protein [Bacteroidaceae bacterium]